MLKEYKKHAAMLEPVTLQSSIDQVYIIIIIIIIMNLTLININKSSGTRVCTCMQYCFGLYGFISAVYHKQL